MTETPETPQPAPQNTAPALFLRAQYIKDISFENPRAPASLFSLQEPPAMEVGVNLGAQRLDENVFEVSVQINVRATSEKTTVFLIDLVYAGVVELQNIPEAELEQVLFINAASLVYPFARRVISDISRDGGFPPVALEPLDFTAMYVSQRQQRAAAPAVAETAPEGTA